MRPLAPLVTVMVAGVLYHLTQKLAPSDRDPWSLLVVVYGVAFTTSVLLWQSTGSRPLLPAGASASSVLVTIGLGVTVVGVEVGFLLAYRSGWPLTTAATLVNTALGVALALIGVACFGEHLRPRQCFGLALAASGMVLAGWK